MPSYDRGMDTAATTSDSGVGKALEHLNAVLVPGETVDAWAVQRRIYALKHRRVLLAATSGRLIYIRRQLLGGFDLTDLRWQDLEDVTLHVGLFAATIGVRSGKTTDLSSEVTAGQHRLEFAGLRKSQAEAVYRVCQAQDQAWREKRRVRDLEELRARSGGVQLGVGAGIGAASATASDAPRRLQEAKQLLDNRLITDAEYEAIKAKILSST
jgi:Bacterial PH domain